MADIPPAILCRRQCTTLAPARPHTITEPRAVATGSPIAIARDEPVAVARGSVYAWTALIGPEGRGRVDAGRAPGGHVAGERRDRHERDRRCRETERVGGVQVEHEAREHARESVRRREAAGD